jgi:hypothetical protein
MALALQREAQPKARKRFFIKRLLTDPPEIKPLKELLDRIHDRPYDVDLNEIREAKSLFLSIHPSERNERLQLSLFAAFSRVIVGSTRKFIRLKAQNERDSISWTFRETLIPPASAKEN